MNLDSKLALISATICWLKEFDVLKIPHDTKISYFLEPEFHNAILKYLLAVDECIPSRKVVLRGKSTSHISKSSQLENFLDIVSIEFNKHMGNDQEYDDDPDKETDESSEKNGRSIGNKLEGSAIFQVDILNKFLVDIDIDILSSWTSSIIFSTPIEYSDIGNNDIKPNIKSDNDGYNKINTIEYEQKKISSEIYELSIIDLKDLINQLYLYMCIMLCIGLLGRRAAWGLTQINYLDKTSKFILKTWCKIEANFESFDLDSEYEEFNLSKYNFKNIISATSLGIDSENINYIMGSLGWMNVSDNTPSENNEKFDISYIQMISKGYEILKIQNEKFSIESERLKSENINLNHRIEELRKENQVTVIELNEKIEKVRIKTAEEIKHRYESKIREIELRCTDFNENFNTTYLEMEEEIKSLKLENMKVVSERNKNCSQLNREQNCSVNKGHSQIQLDNYEVSSIAISEEKSDELKKVIKELLKRQVYFSKYFSNKINNDMILKNKYKIMKDENKILNERNEQYLGVIDNLLRKDKIIWECILSIKIHIYKMDEQIKNMKDTSNMYKHNSQVSQIWIEEFEILNKAIEQVIIRMCCYKGEEVGGKSNRFEMEEGYSDARYNNNNSPLYSEETRILE